MLTAVEPVRTEYDAGTFAHSVRALELCYTVVAILRRFAFRPSSVILLTIIFLSYRIINQYSNYCKQKTRGHMPPRRARMLRTLDRTAL